MNITHSGRICGEFKWEDWIEQINIVTASNIFTSSEINYSDPMGENITLLPPQSGQVVLSLFLFYSRVCYYFTYILHDSLVWIDFLA